MKEPDLSDYQRVTSILYPFSGLEKINRSIVEKAARRGTLVHQICEGMVKGLGEIGVTEETEPYVESFKKWWGEGKKVLHIEKRFFNDAERITGQADYILDEGILTLVDLKTSYRPSPTWAVQGSAYYWLAQQAEIDIQAIKFVHLSRKGKAPKVYEYEADPTLFLDTLRVYRHFWPRGYNG